MLDVKIKVNDTATPALAGCLRLLTDKTELHQSIAAHAEVLTREHILFVAAPQRHATANRLGATPTGYLTRRGNAIESSSTAEEAVVTLGGAPEIFARVDGPVTVRAVRSKYLTIPASAQAYGRRAREMQGLKPMKLGKSLALVAEDEAGREFKGRKGRKSIVHYWLKEAVTLPHDPTLLPNEAQYTKAAEQAAADLIRMTLAGEAAPTP